jgi:Asp/Glu/hydantoin racemase
MRMAIRKIVLIHASRAAVEPLMKYYPREAPELEITNLLDDGVMRLFTSDSMPRAQRRLQEMVTVGRDIYAAELALLTCSAVPRPVMAELRSSARIPLLKIDEPMARLAVRAGTRIGLIVTFPPTQSSTHKLLADAASEAGTQLEIVDELAPKALEALLAGDQSKHDTLMLAAADRLATKQVQAIVLAQVSMAHLVPRMKERLALPVFSSLETSLAAVRELLGAVHS